MKKLLLLLVFAGSAGLLTHCKSKKKPARSPGNAGFEREYAVARKRWPGVAVADLQTGHQIYTTRCNRCHGNFEIPRFTEKKWLHEIDEMAPKAKLSAEEKLKLTRYILSNREAFTLTD